MGKQTNKTALMTQRNKTIAYFGIILIGWIIGEYPYVPSFQLGFIVHQQPDYTVFDKCISVTLFSLSFSLLLALWHNKWLMILLSFITWGMFNNLVDEFTHNSHLFGTSEKISLLLALTTTTILIWKKHRQK